MRKLKREKRELIIKTLIDGVGINACARICGVSNVTVLRLLADIGQLCQDLHDLEVRNLPLKRVQVDEVWAFVGCKENSKLRGKQGHGDIWCWVAQDAETRLVVSYYLGDRGPAAAEIFLKDFAARTNTRIQLTSDGHKHYLEAVRSAFGKEIDYAQLVKTFGDPQAKTRQQGEIRCIGCAKTPKIGNPDPDHVSTSYVERSNLSLRTAARRYTRLSINFSKEVVFHVHAVALHYFAHNFIKVCRTIKKTPAMAAGITDRVWTVADLIDALEREEKVVARGGRINRADRR